MGFTTRFGSNPVVPSRPSYEALSIAVNTALVWPTETTAGTTPYVAALINVTATAGGLELQMPDAEQGAAGVVSLVANVGLNTFTLTDTAGNPIAVIASTQAWLIALVDNTTTDGTWVAYQLASTTSSAVAAALAGYGLAAVGAQLNVAFPTQYLSVNTFVNSTFDANALVWDGAVGTFQFDLLANLGNTFFVFVSNEGTGALTLTGSSGQTINGQATFVMEPGNSGMVIASSTGFNTYGALIGPLAIVDGGTGALTPGQALINLGGSSIGIAVFEAANAAAIIALLGINQSLITEATVNANQALTAGSSGTFFVCTNAISLTAPLTTGLTKQWFFGAYAQDGAVTITPQATDSVNGLAVGTSFVLQSGQSALFTTDANGNIWPFFLDGIDWAVAAGTSDAITASYTPVNTVLYDGLLLGFRATAPNATTTPTFAPDGLPPHVITQGGGLALQAGSIPGNLAECLVRFNLANTRWELVNPPFLGGAVVAPINMVGAAINETEVTIASAATVALGTAAGNLVNITGAVNITSFGPSIAAGSRRRCILTGAPLITNGANLLCPGNMNIQGAANDSFEVEDLGGGVWQITQYTNYAAPTAGAFTNATVTVDGKGAITALASGAAPAFTKSYVSALTAIPAPGATTNFAHGLGVRPQLIGITFHCVTGQGGWNAGDEFDVGPFASTPSSSGDGLMAYVLSGDTTNIKVLQGSAGNLEFFNPSTGAVIALTQADWNIIVKAWA